MRRTFRWLTVALLLCLCAAACAEGSVNVEVIRVDGMSVVVLTPTETSANARRLFIAKSGDAQAAFALPVALTLIDEEAFEGIAAERVEVTENVVSIAARAFADCGNLREIVIPATVLSVDDHALDGCADVTVYGTSGTEAERFADAAGFTFVDPDTEPETPAPVREAPPVVLPFVPAD